LSPETLPATAASRVAALREALGRAGLDGCLIPSSDPHLSEYLPEHWQGRRWLSGFDGSAGMLVITRDFAGLWTDSRYWIKAESDLRDTGITLMRAGDAGVPEPIDWLAAELPGGSRVGVDGNVLPVGSGRDWRKRLEAEDLELITDIDPLEAVWVDRPPLPDAPIDEHRPPHACRTRSGNLAAVRAAMDEVGASWHLISSLDDIAWLFNLRGDDVPFNPVFLAHALIGPDSATLFVEPDKLTTRLAARLQADGVRIAPYGDIRGALRALPAEARLLIDPQRVTVGLLEACGGNPVVEALNPTQRLKSRKNEAEIAHVRRVMEHDGAALCEFFAWLESAQGGQALTELDIDRELVRARGRHPDFVSPSFGTIAAFKANAAMPHYQATPASHARIEGDGLLLIDSGGQYLGGTTDITRIVPIGETTEAQRRDATAVLKGMIALSQAVFPRGVEGPALDAIARLPIWQAGADYGHGTGHGVGYFLNVHEGPQAISHRAANRPHMGMEPGMITSNEPGLYRPGRWGIRIENLVLCVPAMQTEFGEFLKFETLTLCPIDTRCIVVDLLGANEKDWLNDYHAEVRRRLSPLVEGRAWDWLAARTEPI